MSTKIYVAYRVPKNRVWDLGQELAATARRRAKKLLEATCRRMHTGIQSPEFLKTVREMLLLKTNERPTLWQFSCYLERQFHKQAHSPYRDVFDFSASLAFWTAPGGRYAYVIPHEGDGLRLGARPFWGFLSRSGLEEYGYWNNTDKPRHLTVKAWEERRRAWDLAMPDDSSRSPLILDVIHTGNWFQLKLFRKT